MSETIRIGIIGDFRPGFLVQESTNDALKHAADSLSLPVESVWMPTPALLRPEGRAELANFDGIWSAPGNPNNREGALLAVQYAREQDRPMFGT